VAKLVLIYAIYPVKSWFAFVSLSFESRVHSGLCGNSQLSFSRNVDQTARVFAELLYLCPIAACLYIRRIFSSTETSDIFFSKLMSIVRILFFSS